MTKFTPHVVKIGIFMTKFTPHVVKIDFHHKIYTTCGKNEQIYTTHGENLSVHLSLMELPGLCIKILDKTTVSRLIFVCLSPKSHSRESEICGENLWCKSVLKICLCVPMESVCPCLFVPLWCKFVMKM